MSDMLHVIQTAAYPTVIHPDHAAAIRDALIAAGFGDVAKARREVACDGCKNGWPLEIIGSGPKHRQPFQGGFVYSKCRALAQQKEPSDAKG